MFWIEMSRDSDHGGGNWGLTKCLWAPAYKKSNSNKEMGWAYWEKVLSVKEGDIILHLVGRGNNAKFVGFSIADSNGYETTERPPNPGQWEYAIRFYRADLRDYTPLEKPIILNNLFSTKNHELYEYYLKNKDNRTNKLLSFFVIQNNKLQCQNGGYLSEVDEELAKIIFDDWKYSEPTNSNSLSSDIATSTTTRTIKTRLGHQAFSKNVKNNYNYECCFPNCLVNSERYLRASHIARWSDVPELRGNTANGLCLCLMHDQDFEKGMFTLTSDFRIKINKKVYNELLSDSWAVKNIIPFDGLSIKQGIIPPSLEAIRHHWNRIKFI